MSFIQFSFYTNTIFFHCTKIENSEIMELLCTVLGCVFFFKELGNTYCNNRFILVKTFSLNHLRIHV